MVARRKKAEETQTKKSAPKKVVRKKKEEPIVVSDRLHEPDEVGKVEVEVKEPKVVKMKADKELVIVDMQEGVVERKPNRYRKLGGGALYIPNVDGTGRRIIKPNQVFEAYPQDLPVSFIDTLVLIQEGAEIPVTPQMLEVEVVANSTSYFKEEVEGGFNIVDKKGKVLNEKVLTEKEANELINALL